MRKITCYIESLAGGGAEHQMVILCELLHKFGYEVTLVTYADIKDHYTISADIKRVHIAPNRPAWYKIFKTFIYVLCVDTDCVVSYRSPCNMRIMLPAIFRRNIKYIMGERNANLTGQPTKYERWVVDRGLYKYAHFIVPNSYTQAQYIANKRPEWLGKIITINNYTDISQFKPSLMPDNSCVLRIAVFARFSKQKNIGTFIEMISQLIHATNQRFKIEWYGQQNGSIDGYNQDYLNAKQHIYRCNVGQYIELKQAIVNPASVMDNYHAICLPSLYEGFSNSIAEGICSAKPMLVSDVSDNRIMVRDGYNGFLFNPRDINSMLTAFLHFFDTTHEERILMSQNSRKIALSLFNEEKFIRSYIKLIED